MNWKERVRKMRHILCRYNAGEEVHVFQLKLAMAQAGYELSDDEFFFLLGMVSNLIDITNLNTDPAPSGRYIVGVALKVYQVDQQGQQEREMIPGSVEDILARY
jgi:hypothetical protein